MFLPWFTCSSLFPPFISAVLHRRDNQQAAGLLCGRSNAGCGSGPYLWKQNRAVGRPGIRGEKFQGTTRAPLCPTPVLHLQQWPVLRVSARDRPGAWAHSQPACFQVKTMLYYATNSLERYLHKVIWQVCHLPQCLLNFFTDFIIDNDLSKISYIKTLLLGLSVS